MAAEAQHNVNRTGYSATPEGRGTAYLACFVLAVAAHLALGFALQHKLIQGPEYQIEPGETSIEVSLVAAMPADALTIPDPSAPIQTEAEVLPSAEPTPELPLPVEVPPAPESEPPAASEPAPQPAAPEPMPPPPPADIPPPAATPDPPRVAKPTPLAKPSSPPKTVSQPKPTQSNRRPVGDGSSPESPGRDATTQKANAGQANAKPGYLRNPHPSYPKAARRARQEGVVYVKVTIDSSGRATAVSLARSSGHRLLDERAVSTIKERWRFKPARSGGVAIPSEVIIPIKFQLD